MTADEEHATLVGDWARKHYKQTIVIRILLAPWILFVTVFLCIKGNWWGLVFLPFLPSTSGFCVAWCVTPAREATDLAAESAASLRSRIVANPIVSSSYLQMARAVASRIGR